MELHQLRSFVAVAEEGNLTRAAERLFISQPAVSGHVKALEEELGVKLFLRSPRGMQLTKEGHALHDQAQGVLAGVDRLMTTAQSMHAKLSGPFRLGLNTDSSFLRIAELFRAVHDAHPGIDLELVQSTSSRIATHIKSGALDGGFLFMDADDPDLDSVALEQVQVFITGPAEWEERCRGCTLAELATMEWVWTPMGCPCNQMALEEFAKAGFKPNIVAVTDSDPTRRELVSAGTGLGLMHENEIGPLLEDGRIFVWEDHSFAVNASFAWAKKHGHDPLLMAVRDVIVGVWDADHASA